MFTHCDSAVSLTSPEPSVHVVAQDDTPHNDRHPDLKADYVPANRPFNDSDWRGDLLKDDKRGPYGVPNGSRPAQERRLRPAA